MEKKVEYGIPRLVDARYGEIILRILPNTTPNIFSIPLLSFYRN